jgi:molybdopterin/thiamine biosynthesis adenylyltransferase
MKNLPEIIANLHKQNSVSVPTLFDLTNQEHYKKVEALFSEGKIAHISDDFEEESRELYGVQNPSKVYTPNFEQDFQELFINSQNSVPLWQQGRWVYYPWRSLLAHILPEKEYFQVRTARNKNLITAEEQEKFYTATVGIGGLSVGSSIAYALTLQGGPKHLKIADMDHLALSNTNRVLAGVESLGILKVEMAARRIYEINPYAEIELFPQGISPENVEEFFTGLDLVIDELDNIAVKFLIRQYAKKHSIPVVMGADNGDNAVIDVERYDEDPNLEFFHGRLGNVTYEELKNLDKFGIGRTITKHIGPENITIRMQESLLEMGKTIVSWPQLGGAALANGAAVAYCVRKILNGQKVIDNRSLLSLDEKLDPNYNLPLEVSTRKTASEGFAKMFGL